MKSVANGKWPGVNTNRTTLAAALAWLAWNDPNRPIAPSPLDPPPRTTTAAEWNAALSKRRESEFRISGEVDAAAKQLLPVLHRLEPSGKRWKSGPFSSEAEFADLARIPVEYFDSTPELLFDNLFVLGGPWIQVGSEGAKPRLYSEVSLAIGLFLREFEASGGPTFEKDDPPIVKQNQGGRPRHPERDIFGREVVRLLALDGGNMTRTDLRKHMRAWVTSNMEALPDDRTVERWIDQFVNRNLLPD